MLDAMPRVVAKVLDAFAAAFFIALRAVAAITGRSLIVSVVILMVTLIGLTVVVEHFVGVWPILPLHAVFVATLVRLGTIAAEYSRAFEYRDFAEVMRLRQIIEGTGEPKSRAMRAMKRVGDGELLIEFEMFKEAAAVLATVELSALPEIARPGVLSELGYAHAHGGQVDRAVTEIETALAEADAQASYPSMKRFHLVRRHGIALSLAGEHERAVDVLAPLATDFQGNSREWAEAFFFLGRSHAALDDAQLATHSFVRAVMGDGPFVPRAWSELEKLMDPSALSELREWVRKEQEKETQQAKEKQNEN